RFGGGRVGWIAVLHVCLQPRIGKLCRQGAAQLLANLMNADRVDAGQLLAEIAFAGQGKRLCHEGGIEPGVLKDALERLLQYARVELWLWRIELSEQLLG